MPERLADGLRPRNGRLCRRIASSLGVGAGFADFGFPCSKQAGR